MLAFSFAILAAYLFGCWALAGKYLSPTRLIAPPVPGLTDAEFGGTPCFVTPNLKKAKVIFVLAHGLRGDRSNFGVVAKTLADHGYGAILPAMTGQDANRAKTIGFGADESTLLAKIMTEVHALPQHPKVIIGGVSMGGASAWLATEKAPAEAIITESAYADFPEAASFYLDKAFPGGRYILAPVIWFGALRSGININDIRPDRAAATFKGPVVLIHAGDDHTVPLRHGERLAKAAHVPLHVIADAQHARCRDEDPVRYDQYYLDLARQVESR